ncbi:endonuclease/exonuclease/phosphatase family protein [Sediminibacter sp. Hel_I_10]|uniref:endonuclease/exonuclease/phosphatase family protein n=1 Tax=Sediminibacter sp. Hel_I_10 TaxID=1392490 RepID=UPI00047D32D3|nr:endonuclease/exonuclease/phosphatase family protein [Sediminibacter sp. Hel_I_10]
MVQNIAFYNLENLFDFRDDRSIGGDNDFLPNSEKRWTKKRYEKKIENLGHVISKIGNTPEDEPPVLIGLAEVENKRVLHDLTQSRGLRNHHYKFVHFDSKDERGIDVALLYNPLYFKVETTKTLTFSFLKDNGNQDYTRDILMVSGKLHNLDIHVFVNHWPSRREGLPLSNPKRRIAAENIITAIHKIKQNELDAKIIIMGDFNDNPSDESIQYLTKNANLYNPMATMRSYTKGSLNHNFTWNLFDQILFTPNFLSANDGELKFEGAEVFDAIFLKQDKGRFKGQPSRTFAGQKYMGGFSDHFPVFITLSVKNMLTS